MVDGLQQTSFWSSPEELMSYEPDIFILMGASDENYEKLVKIAPVIICPKDLHERITLLGEIFNMEDKAAELLQEYEDDLAKAKDTVAKLDFDGKTFSITQDSEDSGATVRLFYNDNARGGNILYDDFGFEAPQKFVDEYPDYMMDVSMEVLNQYIGDYIIYIRNADDFNYYDSPIWTSLPAVQAGNVVEFEGDLFYHQDIISTRNQLKLMTDALVSFAAK
ncbi:MAG: ABC transporter substrate-binding protein [Oscillospiraceae bacterium]